jgi:hypothetical protein
MKKAKISAGALMLGFGLALVSTASHALGTSDERAACTPDVFRLCSSEIPNVTAIIACMKAKKSQLSPGCRAAFNTPEPVKEASKTRSIATPANQWCNFKGIARDPIQENWIGWCGHSALLK